MNWNILLMKLRTHDRYDYSAINDRPVYDWPGGKRLAVYLAVNVEHFAFGEGLGAELVPSGHPPDVLNFAWRDYGNRVGVWRMLDLFDQLAMPSCCLLNSSIYDYCPEVPAAFRARGDEIVAHGRSNSERQSLYAEEEERKLILETTETISQYEGKPPEGWLGPWIAESLQTPDLLKEKGYRYVLDWGMDDQPVWLRTSHGPLLSVPYPQEVNDLPAIINRKMNPEDFAGMIVDNFEEMLVQSRKGSLVMGIALHPHIFGQPYRLKHLRQALQKIVAKRDEIWLTHAGAIARHFAESEACPQA